ncbi:MAG: RNA methyltransferase [Polyangiaceae bacterium]
MTVVFDSPYDPHNGAAVLRTSEAFGLARIHVVEEGSNGFLAAGTVARGTQKWMDVVCHGTPEPALAMLDARGLELVAAHPDGELEPHDLRTIPKFALVVGNERDGIQPAIMERCTRRVRVPMRGFVESLNVSVTTAILLHAAVTGRDGDLPEEDRKKLYARGLYFSAKNAERILEAVYGRR